MLDAITAAPAFVRNGRMDILAANQPRPCPLLAARSTARTARRTRRASSSSTLAPPTSSPTGSRSQTDAVAVLRAEAGRNPYDRGLSDLIGELSTRSENFRTRWATHNVRYHDTGPKRFHHPLVGELELTYEAMKLVADPGLTLFVYTAEPGSRSEQALNLLASWAATPWSRRRRIGAIARRGGCPTPIPSAGAVMSTRSSASIAVAPLPSCSATALDPVDPACERRDAVAVGGKGAGGRLTDARRRTGDDREAAGVLIGAHVVELSLSAGFDSSTANDDESSR